MTSQAAITLVSTSSASTGSKWTRLFAIRKCHPTRLSGATPGGTPVYTSHIEYSMPARPPSFALVSTTSSMTERTIATHSGLAHSYLGTSSSDATVVTSAGPIGLREARVCRRRSHSASKDSSSAIVGLLGFSSTTWWCHWVTLWG